jgi:hypothetical protein
MITIDLQDDDTRRTEQDKRLEKDKSHQGHRRNLDRDEVELRDEHTQHSGSGLISRLFKLFRKKE